MNRQEYVNLHRWMARHFPKANSCDECGLEGKTQYASIGHVYTRDRKDWRELCQSCHQRLDDHPFSRGGMTHSEETRAKIAAAKRAADKPTHCRRGHLFTEENTIVKKDGYRRCRTCNNVRERDRQRLIRGWRPNKKTMEEI